MTRRPSRGIPPLSLLVVAAGVGIASGRGVAERGRPLTIPVFSEIHNGGHPAFGPDGFLDVGMGDTDPRGHARDLGALLGKLLRIDVDRAEGGLPYAIPAGNPFRGRAGARPGDFETRRVGALEPRDRRATSIVEIGRAPERIASFGEDEEGELYLVGLDRGLIYRIDATGSDLAPASASREVAATSRRDGVAWRYTLDRPSPSWASPDFDASASGGFGTRGNPTPSSGPSGGPARSGSAAPPPPARSSPTPSGWRSTTTRTPRSTSTASSPPGSPAPAATTTRSTSSPRPSPPSARGRTPSPSTAARSTGGQYIDVGLVELPPRRP